jgi:hypothetical protein
MTRFYSFVFFIAAVALTGCTVESQVFEVGPDGGRFDWEGGYLDLPAGALDETVELTVTAVSGAPSGAVSQQYRFEPHEQQFAVPITVGIEFEGAGEPTVFWSEDGEVFDPLSTMIDGSIAVTEVEHFSWGHASLDRLDDPCSSLFEPFDTEPVFGGGEDDWNLTVSMTGEDFYTDLAAEWNDGSDGRLHNKPHMSIHTSGANNFAAAASFVTPWLHGSGCQEVELSYVHEIATIAVQMEEALMTAEIQIEPEGGQRVTVYDHAPLSHTGDIPPVVHDLTPDLPESGRYRVWFSSTIVHYDQANQNRDGFWVIRDVQITGQ